MKKLVPVSDEKFEIIKEVYKYDRDLPLEVRQLGLWPWRTPYHLEKVLYRSTHNQMVSASFAKPLKAKGKLPAVLLIHGWNTIWGRFEDWACDWREVLVKAGYAVLSADNFDFGERRFSLDSWEKKYKYHGRERIIQSAVDGMRGIDYLAIRPDIDKSRIALLGGSLGAYIGAITGAFDKRLKTVILTVIGIFKNDNLVNDKGLDMLVHSANFISRISPTPLLMVNGKKDEAFPAEGSKLLFDLAGEPKKQVWYNTTHFMPPKKYNRDVLAWLKTRL